MDPQVLQAAERVLAWCRAQVWDSVVNGPMSDDEIDADGDWTASPPDDGDETPATPS